MLGPTDFQLIISKPFLLVSFAFLLVPTHFYLFQIEIVGQRNYSKLWSVSLDTLCKVSLTRLYEKSSFLGLSLNFAILRSCSCRVKRMSD